MTVFALFQRKTQQRRDLEKMIVVESQKRRALLVMVAVTGSPE
ncbi:MAG: hypothetical protein ACKVHL_04580 [Rhodospirillales bacterium]|jgi:hypothetical protein